MDFGYYIAKLRYKLHGNRNILCDYYRKSGAKIGGGCLICTPILGPEACLIEIGNDTTISTNVVFVTHDFSVKNLSPKMNNIFGEIKIGNNCFIGENSILLYGVSLGNNIIVAAGSVVTHSFDEEHIVIGGNPARKIGNWNKFYSKVKDKSLSEKDLVGSLKKYPEKFIKRSYYR